MLQQYNQDIVAQFKGSLTCTFFNVALLIAWSSALATFSATTATMHSNTRDFRAIDIMVFFLQYMRVYKLIWLVFLILNIDDSRRLTGWSARYSYIVVSMRRSGLAHRVHASTSRSAPTGATGSDGSDGGNEVSGRSRAALQSRGKHLAKPVLGRCTACPARGCPS